MSVVSESATVPAMETITASEIIDAAKHMALTDIFKLLKAYATEAEKRVKSNAKGTKKRTAATEKKEKKPVPTQLRKNHAWVAFTLKHAQENGWEEFVITKAKSGEEILMSASTTHEGANIYEDSINEKTPKGRQINRSEAMSLAKVRKDANHSSWEEFEVEFAASATDETSVSSESSDEAKSTTSSKKTVTRKTAAEKEVEKEEKKAAKEKEKAEKKAAKEEEAAVKKAEKETEKAAKEKEKVEKKPATKVSPAPVPKKAAGGAGAKASDTETDSKPAKAVKKVAVKPKAEGEKIPTVADDGQAHVVSWKGKNYYMTADGSAWIQNKDKSMGKWAGMFDATKNILDETAEEPAFDEE